MKIFEGKKIVLGCYTKNHGVLAPSAPNLAFFFIIFFYRILLFCGIQHFSISLSQ